MVKDFQVYQLMLVPIRKLNVINQQTYKNQTERKWVYLLFEAKKNSLTGFTLEQTSTYDRDIYLLFVLVLENLNVSCILLARKRFYFLLLTAGILDYYRFLN